MLSNLSQLSFGSALLLIFIICITLVLLRGLARALVGCIAISIAAIAAFLTWQHIEPLSLKYLGQSYAVVNGLAPAFAFFISFLLMMLIARLIMRPFGDDAGDISASEFAHVLGKLLLALIPTSILAIVLAGILHHVGTIASLKSFSNQITQAGDTKVSGYCQELAALIQATTPSVVLETIDPIATPTRVRLAKVLILQEKKPSAVLMSTKTKKPIEPINIAKEDDLKLLIKKGDFAGVLRHKALATLLKDSSVTYRLQNIEL